MVSSAAADPTIASKQAQARAVLEQIQSIDMELGRAVEAYNGANVELDRLHGELKTNARHLTIARGSLQTAQQRLAQRLVSIYVDGGDTSALELVLGAKSLDELLDGLDTIERVGAHDARVLGEVKTFKREVTSRKAKLQKAEKRQRVVVAQRAEQRRSIEGQLAQRRQMLVGLQDEIARLQAAEQRRAAALAAQAAARVAAARQAARQVEATPAAASEAAGAAAAPVADAALEEVDARVQAPPPASGAGAGAVAVAMRFLGVPYRWGGADPSGFDCSGLTMYAYAAVGVSLPHHAASQFGMGTPISKDQLAVGDLVFFNGLGHMGMYVGGGSFIHAPHTGDVVKISSLNDSWYARTYVGARRVA